MSRDLVPAADPGPFIPPRRYGPHWWWPPTIGPLTHPWIVLVYPGRDGLAAADVLWDPTGAAAFLLGQRVRDMQGRFAPCRPPPMPQSG